jgi:mono/diheme cytochrome c family protein
MIRPRMAFKHGKIAALAGVLAVAGTLAACGEAKVEDNPENSAAVNRGAELFYERCSGCHTLSAAASEGSAVSVHDVERVDGPNFNERKETVDQVLYAIRNGGFSGAIMPQNIVVGKDAQDVAEFLAKYSGSDVADTSTESAGNTGDG